MVFKWLMTMWELCEYGMYNVASIVNGISPFNGPGSGMDF